MPKKPLPAEPPFVAMFAAQKSSGKTHVATAVADMLAINGLPFCAFQIDDQKRLAHMIGDTVTDLRPDPDRLVEDPTLATRAITPFYDACRAANASKVSVLLDTGANEVEHLSNFLRDVGFADDIAAWQLPVIAFVPFFPLDPESAAQSAFTIRRLRDAVPNLRVVLVENRYGGSSDRIVPGSIAEANYQDLLRTATGLERIVMPAIAREYWAPFEGAGIRFIKALAMDPVEGATQLGRSIGEIKVMKSNVARFWRAMHAELSTIVILQEELEAGRLPDLVALQARFGPDPAAVPSSRSACPRSRRGNSRPAGRGRRRRRGCAPLPAGGAGPWPRGRRAGAPDRTGRRQAGLRDRGSAG